MTLREHVLQQALALPVPHQAYVAHQLESHLIAYLPSEAEKALGNCDDEMLTELRWRSIAYRSGATTARNAGDAMAELWERQTQESAK
jgi:hypothetical protein